MKTKILLFAILVTGIVACRKEPGPGGKAHVRGHLYYHNTMMTNGNVYIWYGVNSVSDCSSGYDSKTTCNAHGEFEFHDMCRGDYFLYGTCLDDSGTIRTGKLHVQVKSKSEMVQADIAVE